MKRAGYLIAGLLALGLGLIGAFVPLLPTVPFMILAAFCFSRSSPTLERWLTGHPAFGPHILNWRERGAINRKGKVAAASAFAVSAIAAVLLLGFPKALIALGAIAIGCTWVLSRPTA